MIKVTYITHACLLVKVRGDKTINYGRVLEVMGRLSGAGFSKVALISEPYKN